MTITFLKNRINNTSLDLVIRVILYVLFFISLSLIFALEKKWPFNIIIIFLWGLLSLSTAVYIVLFGKLKIDLFVLLMIGFMSLQLFSWALNGFGVFNSTGLLMCIMSIVIYELCIQEKIAGHIIFKVLVLSTWVFILFFVIYYFPAIRSFTSGTKMSIDFGNSNDIARSLSYALVINFASAFVSKKKWLSVILITVSILVLLLIYMIGSVSNLLTCLLTMSVIPIFLVRKKYKIFFIICLIIFVVAFIVSINLPFMKYFKTRLQGMFNSFFNGNGRGDASFEGRFKGAYYAFDLFFYRPFFGNGFDSVNSNYVIMAHNNIAEIAADFGIFALLIEEYLIVFPFVFLLKHKKESNPLFQYSPIVLVGLFFMFFFQMFLVSFNSKIESIIIPLSFSMINIRLESIKELLSIKKEIKYVYYRVDI